MYIHYQLSEYESLLFQIHLKFNMKEKNSHDFSLLLLEMSERHQIRINHQISWVDMFHIAPGSFQYHLLKPEITQSIPTKRNKCNEENTLRVFDCYNDYYMKKLDCSLPWLQNYSGSLRKCGSTDSIDRLIETMTNLDKNENEINRMGCNKSNCKTTKWNVVKSEALEAASKNVGEIGFKISYSTKVINNI